MRLEKMFWIALQKFPNEPEIALRVLDGPKCKCTGANWKRAKELEEEGKLLVAITRELCPQCYMWRWFEFPNIDQSLGSKVLEWVWDMTGESARR